MSFLVSLKRRRKSHLPPLKIVTATPEKGHVMTIQRHEDFFLKASNVHEISLEFKEAYAKLTNHDPLDFALENTRLRARIRELEKHIFDSQSKPAPQKQVPAPNTVPVQKLNIRASYDGFRY